MKLSAGRDLILEADLPSDPQPQMTWESVPIALIQQGGEGIESRIRRVGQLFENPQSFRG